MSRAMVRVKCWGRRPVAYWDAEREVVLVFDWVAGHFTACHSLTPRQVARVRRLTS